MKTKSGKIGVSIAFISVLLLAGTSQGAGFQSAPNQVFGLHWGMSIEDAQLVRTLEKKKESGKFAIYNDKSFNEKEMPGAVAVLYLAMNGRIGGAFIGLHCENDTLAFIKAFTVVYGLPHVLDKKAMAVEWNHSGNILQIDLIYNMVAVGNRVIIESAEEVLEKFMKEAPVPKSGPPIIKPGPRTGG